MALHGFLRARELLTMASSPNAEGDPDARRVGLIEDGGVWVEDDHVRWVGPFVDRPQPDKWTDVVAVPIALPGLVECHTHSLFAGSRHEEFTLRNTGRTYAEILEAGGGIHNTVARTREASDKALSRDLRARLQTFHEAGCALVEVKTGYGLSHTEEIRHLRLIREAGPHVPCDVVATYLGAHAIPSEFREDRSGYIDEICNRTLPAISEGQLAEAVDVFCDRGAFAADEALRILGRAEALGLARRIHTDELSHSLGCPVAAEVSAHSADHCEYIDDADIAALSKADVAAVLLPGVTIFLDCERRPPARRLLDAGVRVALSTDYNPGSSHTQDLWLMATLGCTLLRMTAGEALLAITRVPAEVLGRRGEFGTIEVGSRARLLSASLPSWRALPYHMAYPRPTSWINFERPQ